MWQISFNCRTKQLLGQEILLTILDLRNPYLEQLLSEKVVIKKSMYIKDAG